MINSIEEKEAELAAASDDGARTRLLNELGLMLSRLDPERSLSLAAEAASLAVENNEPASHAEALRITAYCHETLSDYPTAMGYAQQARELFQKIGDRTGEGRCLNAIGVIAFSMTRFTDGLEALERAREIFTTEGFAQGLASAHNNIGMIHQELGNYPEALGAYQEALRINEERGDEVQAGANIGNISNIYFYLGDHERSFEYDNRALVIARRHNNLYSITHILESISSNYKERGELDHALEALNEALEISRQIHERRYEAAILIKLGSLYELRNEPKLALECFKEGAKIAVSIAKRDLVAGAQLRIGMLHLEERHYKRAVPVLRKGLLHAKEGELHKLQCDLQLKLAEALHGAGEHGEAFVSLKEHVQLADALFNSDRQRAVAEMAARFDVERAERERERLRIKNQHLEEVMEMRSKELSAMAMRLVQKNAFLQKLRKETLQLGSENPASKNLLDGLLRAIMENLHGDNEWERFEQEFQLMHHNFLNVISQRYPTLTPGELKICAMLKINLSNKEIANLLSVSIRSIESHRYSIRKKLGLAPDANLTAWLVGMG
jgi:tetratricopeptide (TPR) repeat protein/DNA-binding CsgD family transcriptional regulator